MNDMYSHPDLNLVEIQDTCEDKLKVCNSSKTFSRLCVTNSDVQFCRAYQKWRHEHKRDCYDFLMYIDDEDEKKPIIKHLIDTHLKKAMETLNVQEESFPSDLSPKERLFRLCCSSGFHLFFIKYQIRTKKVVHGYDAFHDSEIAQPNVLWDLIKYLYRIGYEYPNIENTFELNSLKIVTSIEIISNGELLTKFTVRKIPGKDPLAFNFTVRVGTVTFVADDLGNITKRSIEVRLSYDKLQMIDDPGGSYPVLEERGYIISTDFPSSPFVSLKLQ